ncbi:MAG: ribonuclease HII [Prevotellaceae bacterium]|nr:ribonuclease HII [Prevotellaceae bacterium]
MKTISLLSCAQPQRLEAGCDEAGRGCLAGPVFAAAVILPSGFHHPLLNDSKQMSESRRNELREIIEREAVAWSVASVTNTDIDKLNILRASITAMHRALDSLKTPPEFILVDGNRFYPYRNIPHQCIVKGDAIYAAIAAASVLAKTYRDELMQAIACEYPQYGWKRNKGYPTQAHREAICQYGATPYHRKSFHLTNEQLTLL